MVEGPGGKNPWLPNQPGDPEKATATPEASPIQTELANERPVRRSNVPVKIMIGALLALIVTIGGVGFLVTRGTAPTDPVATPIAADPTGVPRLPVAAGEYSRDPGDAATPPDFGVDRNIQTAAANYRRNGQSALIAVAARPVTDPEALLAQIKARAVRPVGAGFCGREAGNDLDVCVLRRNQTAVFTIGLRDQTIEEIMAATALILEGTE